MWVIYFLTLKDIKIEGNESFKIIDNFNMIIIIDDW